MVRDNKKNGAYCSAKQITGTKQQVGNLSGTTSQKDYILCVVRFLEFVLLQAVTSRQNQ